MRGKHKKWQLNNNMKYLFPNILMLLNLLASITYFYYKDTYKGVYWLAACVLTYCVTYGD